MNQHTPGPWTVEIARRAENAPAFGFAIRAAGRVPFVASAGVATPDHSLIIAEPFRKLVTTGFTPEEVQANGYLIGAAPDLYDSCLSALGALETLKSEHPWVGEIIAGLTRSLKKATEGVHP
jgi:hypothetical protein